MSILSLVLQIIWRFGVYPGIDVGLENSKVEVPRLVKTGVELFLHAPTHLVLVI